MCTSCARFFLSQQQNDAARKQQRYLVSCNGAYQYNGTWYLVPREQAVIQQHRISRFRNWSKVMWVGTAGKVCYFAIRPILHSISESELSSFWHLESAAIMIHDLLKNLTPSKRQSISIFHALYLVLHQVPVLQYISYYSTIIYMHPPPWALAKRKTNTIRMMLDLVRKKPQSLRQTTSM